jgi:hypothetical protein
MKPLVFSMLLVLAACDRAPEAPENAAIMRDGFKPYAPWLEVRLPDGRTGFVRNEDVRGPIEWRAGFMKQQGEWTMVVFVAGD